MTAEEFKHWREGMGWTQAQAADELGLDPRTIRRYEANERPVSRTVARLCELLAERG
jgi:transcriptional regulator with XRE-family HTH domain